MNYISTRDISRLNIYSSAQAIKKGLAPDGGLFVPDSIPSITGKMLMELCECTYYERAAKILSLYLTDYNYEKLLSDCREAYSEKSFGQNAAPVKKINDRVYSLELWHGPTAAFKDMALQIMPRLLSTSLKMTEENKIALILVATSGDTGKAALEGYKDIDGIKIMIYYPVNGVSTVQKLQMATQTGKNVNVCAISGNFDDAQNGVKAIFSDEKFSDKLIKNGYFLSSANSINWGRLAPQIAYYVSAYCDLLNNNSIKLGEKVDICVPTGNFGNIFAAYLAKKMGLPIETLICASNSNNVLTDFLSTGTYDRNRKFNITMSPSMDILISSNLERLLWMIAGPEKTVSYMKQLKETGTYTVDSEIKERISDNFIGYYANENDTAESIRKIFKQCGYLCDTHTAVAMHCASRFHSKSNSVNKMIVVSTASPYKFSADVYKALTNKSCKNDVAAIEELYAATLNAIPEPLKDIALRQVRFTTIIKPCEMENEVLKYLDIK